jgi:hypothetical protein
MFTNHDVNGLKELNRNLPSSTTKTNYISSPIVNNSLKTYHQNIQGLKWKTDEISNLLYSNPPHILCFSEHHKFISANIDNYYLGAKYCRRSLKKGGVCIFVHENLRFEHTSIRRLN